MGKFNKTGKREMPALNTSSLPDLIFTVVLLYDCNNNSRRGLTLKGLEFKVPQAN